MKRKLNFLWATRMLIVTLCLSIAFGFLCQVVLSNMGIFFAIIGILFFVFISTIFDMIGIASASSNIEVFKLWKIQKLEGAETGYKICQHCEKVCSFCADVVGDICSTICGAGGASIVLTITKNTENLNLITLISIFTTAFIAGLTIFFKALMKELAVKKSNKIILILGKIYERTFKKNKKSVDIDKNL